MNYQKIYNQIVERAKSENRKKNNKVYYEAHHIVPICLGGTGSTKNWKWHSNIVLLTAREHFLCHWLLHEIHPSNEKLTMAFFLMCTMENGIQSRYKPSSRIVEYARLQSIDCRKNKKGYWNGKTLSEETKHKIRLANIGKIQSEETKQKRSEKLKGKKRKKEIVDKIRKIKQLNNSYSKISKRVIDCTTNIEYKSVRECMKILKISSRKFYYNINNNIFNFINE